MGLFDKLKSILQDIKDSKQSTAETPVKEQLQEVDLAQDDLLEPPKHITEVEVPLTPQTFTQRGMDDNPYCVKCGEITKVQGTGMTVGNNKQPVGFIIYTCTHCFTVCMSIVYKQYNKEDKKQELKQMSFWSDTANKQAYNSRLDQLSKKLGRPKEEGDKETITILN